MKSWNETLNNPEGKAASWQGHISDKADSLSGNDDYQQRIAEAAFYNAKRRGFEPGGEVSDWLQAEAENGLPGLLPNGI